MRIFVALAALALSAAPAASQSIFIAPSPQTVIGSMEEGLGNSPTHLLMVTNESTVPIVVFGINISSCENVKQFCGGQRTKVAIGPNQKRNVGRVEPKSTERGFTYRWTFSYHADSSDAKALAALREHGIGVEVVDPRQSIPTRIPVEIRRAVIDTTSPPDVEKPLSRERITAEERMASAGGRRAGDEDTRPAFRFKVAYGSILGSTMMPGAPIQKTGPCINPAESARYEKDAKITATPWRPASFDPTFGQLFAPSDLRDSIQAGQDVLVRFVADTTGDAIPESVSILESPHGRISVEACQAAIRGRATPARDKAGKPIRAWVQMPMKVNR